MKWFLLSVLFVVGIASLLWVYGERTIKTIVLILRVSPYEQVIPSAPKILILGDSTGYGTGARQSSNSISGRIGADFPTYSIENKSVNGRTIGELVSVAQSVEGEYALILLQIGGNDILQQRDTAVVEKELRTIVADLTDNTESLVMISSGNVGAASAFDTEDSQKFERITRDFKAVFGAVARDTELTFVDLFLEREDDPFVSNPDTYLAMDGLHPSDEGYGAWYTTLRPTIEKMLERKRYDRVQEPLQ